MSPAARAAVQAGRGLGVALGARPGTFLAGAAAVFALSILAPPIVLSLARKPVDYVTFNPWLTRLPDYLANPDVPLGVKLEKLWALAIFWFSADSPMGGTEWGFAVDVADLVRLGLTSLLFGLYVALWREGRAYPALPADGPGGGIRGGLFAAVVSVFGLSTGPCSVMGCGAPVLPVIGLAFVGLSSSTLKLLAGLSAFASTAVPAVLVVGVGYLGWRVGRRA